MNGTESDNVRAVGDLGNHQCLLSRRQMEVQRSGVSCLKLQYIASWTRAGSRTCALHS